MKIETEWNQYRNACYPKGCHPRQAQEVRQGFCAGMLVAMQAIISISEIEDEDEAMRELEKIKTTITEANRQNAQMLGGN